MAVSDSLGYGFDGSVWSTTRPSAIKAFLQESLYRKEKLVYLRLKQVELHDAAGFAIPVLLDYDDRLSVEMELVRPSFIVDFAGAYLDQIPPFTVEEWAEWERDRQELFEADWKWVK